MRCDLYLYLCLYLCAAGTHVIFYERDRLAFRYDARDNFKRLTELGCTALVPEVPASERQAVGVDRCADDGDALEAADDGDDEAADAGAAAAAAVADALEGGAVDAEQPDGERTPRCRPTRPHSGGARRDWEHAASAHA